MNLSGKVMTMKKKLSFVTLAILTQLLSLSSAIVHAQANTYLLGVVSQFHSTSVYYH